MSSLFKVTNFTLKYLAKPVITRTKQYTKENHSGLSNGLEKFFIWLGNTAHIKEAQLSRKMMNLQGDDELFSRTLSNHDALDSGIDFFFEILLYGLLFCLSLNEIMKYYKKDVDLEKRITNIEEAFEKRVQTAQSFSGSEANQRREVIEVLDEENKKMEKVRGQIEKIIEKTQKTMENLQKEAEGVETSLNKAKEMSRSIGRLNDKGLLQGNSLLDISDKITELGLGSVNVK